MLVSQWCFPIPTSLLSLTIAVYQSILTAITSIRCTLSTSIRQLCRMSLELSKKTLFYVEHETHVCLPTFISFFIRLCQFTDSFCCDSALREFVVEALRSTTSRLGGKTFIPQSHKTKCLLTATESTREIVKSTLVSMRELGCVPN